MTDILNCLRECSQALNGHADVNHTADDDEAAEDALRAADEKNGFTSRCMLLLPVLHCGEVLGVIQLTNKEMVDEDAAEEVGVI